MIYMGMKPQTAIDHERILHSDQYTDVSYIDT